MKSTLLLSVFCATSLAPFVQPSTWLGLEKANRTNIKNYEKHCLGTVYNIGPMDQGEVRRLEGVCALATCLEDRNVKFSGCPFVAISDRVKCRVYKGDLSKEYPECCYQVRCNEEDKPRESYDGYVNQTAVDIKRKEKKKDDEKET